MPCAQGYCEQSYSVPEKFGEMRLLACPWGSSVAGEGYSSSAGASISVTNVDCSGTITQAEATVLVCVLLR